MQRVLLKSFSTKKKCEGAYLLYSLKRRDGESVEKFMERFNKESIEVTDTQDQVKSYAFCHGVKNNQSVEKLHEGLPVKLEGAMGKHATQKPMEKTNATPTRKKPKLE